MIDFSRPGRMILGTKKEPKGHVCVFNANVCSKSRGKFWFGDIDITTDADDLKSLAAKEGEEIFILREMDGRFMNEANPLFERAVARIAPDGRITVESTR